ncbi:hypothetical protein NDU88_005864, partial [Pleurodeles waltl]
FLQGPAEAGLALPAMVMPTEVPEDPATHHIRNTSRSFTHKEAEVPVTEASGAPVPLIKQGSLMFPGQPGPVRRERSCSPGSHGPRISQNKEGERN